MAQRWFYFLYVDENGIYGNLLELLATVVFAFVAFWRALTFVGGARAHRSHHLAARPLLRRPRQGRWPAA